MLTNTLTSLAILKVNIDQNKDYLDYLRPFVLQVLTEYKPDPVTDSVVCCFIQERFGLDIPRRTVQIVLKRISRRHSLKKDHGEYRITGDLPNPRLTAEQSDAERHIAAVLLGLRQFSQSTIRPISSDEDAIVAIRTFLSEFDIKCLRAYLRGTTIPSIEGAHRTDIVLVSKYVQYMQRADPEQFGSFLVLVQGHMLANALLCPDLGNIPKSYREVTFYLDTPLLVQSLGADGEAEQDAMRELISLLGKLGGRVAAFAHSRDELERVILGAANFVGTTNGRGAIVREARKRGKTRSDLLLLATSIDDKLSEAGIQVEFTPRYIERFQIDETEFQSFLDDKLSYQNPRARDYDINSVRSIYVIRADKPAPSVEKARAILVTSNSAFARAAWEYGKQFEPSRDVSSVITDFSLANMAWLKAPMGAPSIPATQVLAFSYAALRPSTTLLDKYMAEIDKLEEEGTITERDHQLLRSNPQVYDELMDLTLGEEAALTAETATQTLERVSREIRKEESAKLVAEQEAHQATRGALSSQQARSQEILRNLFWRCRSRARGLAWVLSGCAVILLAIGLLSGLLGLRLPAPLSLVLTGGFILLSLMNLVFGSTVKNLHAWVQDRCLTWLLKREARISGVDFGGLNID